MPARLDPEVAVAVMRAAGLEPLEGYTRAGSPWRSRCARCSSEVSPTLSNVRGGHGCRICANAAASKAQMIDHGVAVVDMRAAGLEPIDQHPGAGRSWRSLCGECGSEVAPSLSSVRGSYGCRVCGHAAAAKARRVDPDVASGEMLAAGVVTLEPYPGAGKAWLCRCLTCEKQVSPRLISVRGGTAACQFCE